MRTRNLAAVTALLVFAACSDTSGPVPTPVVPDDAAFVASVAGEIGALADHLGPALRQIRQRDGDAACDAQRQEMEQLREQLRQRVQDGNEPGAAQVRLQLRLRAAHAIRAGLGDGPGDEMLQHNERAMEQLRLQIRARTLTHGDTAADQQLLRVMTQLQVQARLALQQGRGDEGLELAARSREQWRARATAGAVDAAALAALQARLGALGEYLGPALTQVRARYGDEAANGLCGDMEQLRFRLQERERDGDGEGAAQERYRLRLAAAHMIRAGLGDAPLEEMLGESERLMTELQLRIQERSRMHEDVGTDQEQLRTMQQLREQARSARAEGRPEEALELAARVREQLRARENSG